MRQMPDSISMTELPWTKRNFRELAGATLVPAVLPCPLGSESVAASLAASVVIASVSPSISRSGNRRFSVHGPKVKARPGKANRVVLPDRGRGEPQLDAVGRALKERNHLERQLAR